MKMMTMMVSSLDDDDDCVLLHVPRVLFVDEWSIVHHRLYIDFHGSQPLIRPI